MWNKGKRRVRGVQSRGIGKEVAHRASGKLQRL